MLWSAFVPLLAPYAAACPNPLLEAEARRAAIRFFRRTRAWVEWLDPVLSMEGKAEYDMDVPTGADVVRVERATLGGNPLAILSFRDAPRILLALIWQAKAWSAPTVKPLCWAMPSLQVQVALAPSLSATGLPDDLFLAYPVGTPIRYL